MPPAPRICPECRFAIPSSSTKCANCGAVFQSEEHDFQQLTPQPTKSPIRMQTTIKSPIRVMVGLVFAVVGTLGCAHFFSELTLGNAILPPLLLPLVCTIIIVLVVKDAFEKEPVPTQERSKSGAPRICPACQFANKSTSTQCDNCGATL